MRGLHWELNKIDLKEGQMFLFFYEDGLDVK